ncbi:hypothetical protein [Streptomyces sp. NPDC018610]|uniref:hypothetical protein n=1 Tax=Streptomyces sp. NPDC018610 TaxID=3365049 RepID=UPI0037AA3B6C
MAQTHKPIAGSVTPLEIGTAVVGGVAQAGGAPFAPSRRYLRTFAKLDFARHAEVSPPRRGGTRTS